ncbi:MAG: cupredoxin domain-containing protein [Firmicutes bacterium]|nr:cupredoxin domain-containing protein [Bacillota bacterium]
MRTTVWLALAAVVVVGGLVLARSMQDRGAPAAITEITVEGTEYAFDPEEITVNRGDTVKIVFRNTGTIEHDWSIPDWDVGTAVVAPGQEATLEFQARRAGSIQFVCTVPGHRELGMVGTLQVR